LWNGVQRQGHKENYIMLFGLTVGLVILIALEAAFLLLCAAQEWPEAATLSLLAAMGISDFWFGTGLFPWVWENPTALLGIIAGYLAAGTVWSFVKWVTVLKRSANEAKEHKAEIFKEYNLTGTLDEAINALESKADDLDRALRERQESHSTRNLNAYAHREASQSLERIKTPPQASENKRRIMAWVAAWPFSILWFIIDEPLKVIWDWFKSSYQRLADRMWKDVLASA